MPLALARPTVDLVSSRGRRLSQMPMQSVNGVRLHYEEHGSGAPILCIHGAGSSAIAWADAARSLRGSAA